MDVVVDDPEGEIVYFSICCVINRSSILFLEVLTFGQMATRHVMFRHPGHMYL